MIPVILTALLLLATLTRFYHLDFNPLWMDEQYTLWISSLSLDQIWITATTTDFTPPLFYWLEHFLPGNLRILPALFGILLVPVVYLIGKEFASQSTGLVMAALVTFSPFLIRHSQDARSYMPALFFVALTFLYFLKCRKEPGYGNLILMGLFAALSFWMHYYSILFTGILLAWITVRSRRGVTAPVTFTLLISPLILPLLSLTAVRTAEEWFGYAGIPLVYITLGLLGGCNPVTALIFFGVFLVGLMVMVREHREDALLLTVLFVVPFVVSLILAQYIPMVPRYMMFLIIPFYLAISSLAKDFTINQVAMVSTIIAMVALPELAVYYTTLIAH